jgi:hypothetical protein
LINSNQYDCESQNGKVYDLLTHPRIVACVRDMLGEDVVGWGAHYFCKLPHNGKTVSWRQDAIYRPLMPSKTVTVWLAIDESIPGMRTYGLSLAPTGSVLYHINRARARSATSLTTPPSTPKAGVARSMSS